VFRVGEVSYGRDPEGILGHLEETKVNLADVAEVGERIGYEYDFGDSWEHELFIEARTEAEAGEIYPACTGGEGACPPEDAGGYPGYQQLKEILADPSNEEYEEMRTWADSQVGDEFDPASFDLAQASARVSTARLPRQSAMSPQPAPGQVKSRARDPAPSAALLAACMPSRMAVAEMCRA